MTKKMVMKTGTPLKSAPIGGLQMACLKNHCLRHSPAMYRVDRLLVRVSSVLAGAASRMAGQYYLGRDTRRNSKLFVGNT